MWKEKRKGAGEKTCHSFTCRSLDLRQGEREHSKTRSPALGHPWPLIALEQPSTLTANSSFFQRVIMQDVLQSCLSLASVVGEPPDVASVEHPVEDPVDPGTLVQAAAER